MIISSIKYEERSQKELADLVRVLVLALQTIEARELKTRRASSTVRKLAQAALLTVPDDDTLGRFAEDMSSAFKTAYIIS